MDVIFDSYHIILVAIVFIVLLVKPYNILYYMVHIIYRIVTLFVNADNIHEASIWYLRVMWHIEVSSVEEIEDEQLIIIIREQVVKELNKDIKFILRIFTKQLYRKYKFNRYTVVIVREFIVGDHINSNVIDHGWVYSEDLEKVNYRKVGNEQFGNIVESFKEFEEL